MSLLLLGLKAGEEICVSGADGAIIARGRADASGRLGLPIPGDDPDTPEKEGLAAGEALAVLTAAGGDPAPLDGVWMEGGPRYVDDGVAVFGSSAQTVLPGAARVRCAPNPFNDRFTVSFVGGRTGTVRIAFFDVSGRRLAEARLAAGAERAVFRADNWPAGVILMRVQDPTRTLTLKVVHLR
jgi:hypothetical protein